MSGYERGENGTPGIAAIGDAGISSLFSRNVNSHLGPGNGGPSCRPDRRAPLVAPVWALASLPLRRHVAFQPQVYNNIAVVLVIVSGIEEENRTSASLTGLRSGHAD